MRMKLMGTKDVKGFDLVKHQEHVHGAMASAKDNDQQEDKLEEIS